MFWQFVFFQTSVFALTDEEMFQQGEILANFLVSGRGVVAKSLIQFKINNSEIADKGFTPEYFANEINQDFKKKTGIDVMAGTSEKKLPDNTLNLLKIMLEASKKVCTDNQSLINMKGVAFKGFIPATYGKQVADIFNEKTGFALKQASLKFRNTYNKPDNYESEVLKKMEKPDYAKGTVIRKIVDGNVRIMRPIYIKKACLPCHGEPKGEIDVAGRKKEGYKEGEIRGAISISIPK